MAPSTRDMGPAPCLLSASRSDTFVHPSARENGIVASGWNCLLERDATRRAGDGTARVATSHSRCAAFLLRRRTESNRLLFPLAQDVL